MHIGKETEQTFYPSYEKKRKQREIIKAARAVNAMIRYTLYINDVGTTGAMIFFIFHCTKRVGWPHNFQLLCICASFSSKNYSSLCYLFFSITDEDVYKPTINTPQKEKLS